MCRACEDGKDSAARDGEARFRGDRDGPVEQSKQGGVCIGEPEVISSGEASDLRAISAG